MTDTSSEKMTDIAFYDYCWERRYVREPKFSWQDIADTLQYGKANSVSIQYKRIAKKLGRPFKPQKTTSMTNDGLTMEIDGISMERTVARLEHELGTVAGDFVDEEPVTLTDIEIHQTKYGDFDATLYVSDLSNDDWIDQYMVYDYKIDINPTFEEEDEEDAIFDEHGNMYEPYDASSFSIDVIDEEFIKQKQLEWRLPYLSELREKLWYYKRAMAMLPRGYGKTESVIALFVRWVLEVRLPLMIITAKSTHSGKLLGKIEKSLKNPRIRRDYGDILGKVTYSKDGMILNYCEQIEWQSFDYPVEVYTFKSAKEGAHPAWLHFEDTFQKESRNVDVNDDVKNDFMNKFLPMLGQNSKFTLTATRYGIKDFYNWLQTTQAMPMFHKRALSKDNDIHLQCPRFTKEYLVQWKERNPASFETQMNNNPVPSSGIYFSKDDWYTVGVPPNMYDGTHYYMVLDPARGFSASADNSAILVVAIKDGVATVVDGFIGKIDDDEKIKKLNAFFKTYNPVNTLVETTFAQIDFRRFQHIRGIQSYRDTQKRAKIMRISAMKSYFMDKLIYILEGIQPFNYLHEEYLSYQETDSSAVRKDDAIDALSMIIQRFGHYLGVTDDKYDNWQVVEDYNY